MACGHTCGASLIGDRNGRARAIAGSTTPGLWVLGAIRKQAGQATESKSTSSTAPWPLLQFPAPVPALTSPSGGLLPGNLSGNKYTLYTPSCFWPWCCHSGKNSKMLAVFFSLLSHCEEARLSSVSKTQACWSGVGSGSSALNSKVYLSPHHSRGVRKLISRLAICISTTTAAQPRGRPEHRKHLGSLAMGLSLLTQWLRVEEMSQIRSQLCHLLTKSYSMDIKEKEKKRYLNSTRSS